MLSRVSRRLPVLARQLSCRFLAYQVKQVESKWQQRWATESATVPSSLPSRREMVLAMFPYPSGNLHMGHVRVYMISDCIARWKRMQGVHVLQPMGWDAFGLPAENAARERGLAPAAWTRANIETMRRQLNSLSFALDWDSELSTCEPEYYRWTQWLFLQLYRHGLAYRAAGRVNWDPVDGTVLANEQVDAEGRSWRSGALVEQRILPQWYIRTTAFAEALHRDLDTLERWPQKVRDMQANWIGRVEGFKVQLIPADSANASSPSDRPSSTCTDLAAFVPVLADLEQAIFVVVPANHPYAPSNLAPAASPLLVRTALRVRHPLAPRATLPVLIDAGWDGRGADILPRFGLASVPFDVEAATALGLDTNPLPGPHDVFDLVCEPAVQYRLRDWLISRQRYWGAPIPMVHCQACGIVPVPEADLPVKLPDLDGTAMAEPGNPLAGSAAAAWRCVPCPTCGSPAQRDTDTIDTFVDSSWYFIRYTDPHNPRELASREALASGFVPVGTYVGGIEHANLHLLYARFVWKFLRDRAGVLPSSLPAEPFDTLITQGMVHGRTLRCPDTGAYLRPEQIKGAETDRPRVAASGRPAAVSWEKMSKSKYNGIDPLAMLERHGVDTVRLYILAKAPPEAVLDWSEHDIVGQARWLQKLHRLAELRLPTSGPRLPRLDAAVQTSIVDVTRSLERHLFHNAISFLIKLVNAIDLHRDFPHARHSPSYRDALLVTCRMLWPLAPHLASEVWELLHMEPGALIHPGAPTLAPPLSTQSWPEAERVVQTARRIAIQINGRFKDNIVYEESDYTDCTPTMVRQDLVRQARQALGLPDDDDQIEDIVYIPGKVINFLIPNYRTEKIDISSVIGRG